MPGVARFRGNYLRQGRGPSAVLRTIPEAIASLEELGQRLGSLVWVEQRLFEILGAWSTIEAAPQAAVHFATASRHHGWHAEVLSGCLPTSPQLLEADLVVAPTVGWQNAVGTLSQLIEPAATCVTVTSGATRAC